MGNGLTKRKRIVDSDEDSESDVAPVIVSEADGWLEKRDSTTQQQSSGLIRKRRGNGDSNRFNRTASVDSLLSLPSSPSPVSVRGHTKRSPDVFEVDDTPVKALKAPNISQILNKSSHRERQERLDRRKDIPVKRERSQKPSDSSDSDGYSEHSRGSSSDVDEWNDEVTAMVKIKERVKYILNHCGKVSQQLRDTMGKWNGMGVQSDPDCMNMTEVDGNPIQDVTGSSASLLRAVDFQNCNPDLELKDYQIVGVNWMRLLHENRVNGVLADDMVRQMSRSIRIHVLH